MSALNEIIKLLNSGNSNEKKCSNCKEWKPFELFRKASNSNNGHRSHCKECEKEYFQNNREVHYKASLKRRSNENYVKFTPHERKAILDRDKWKCQNCSIKVHDRHTGNWNTPDKAHIDHIIPISKGGNSELSNLQTLCRTCNLSKNNKIELQLSLF